MKAIIDEQIEEVLTKNGIWEDFCHGTILCAKCKCIIDINNLGVFIPRRNEEGYRRFDFYCTNSDCLNEVLNA